jgi:hypothetical protein
LLKTVGGAEIELPEGTTDLPDAASLRVPRPAMRRLERLPVCRRPQHRDIQTTIDLYGHPDREAHRKAAERAAQ